MMSQQTAAEINTRVTRAKASIMQESKIGSQIFAEAKIVEMKIEKPEMAAK